MSGHCFLDIMVNIHFSDDLKNYVEGLSDRDRPEEFDVQNNVREWVDLTTRCFHSARFPGQYLTLDEAVGHHIDAIQNLA